MKKTPLQKTSYISINLHCRVFALMHNIVAMLLVIKIEFSNGFFQLRAPAAGALPRADELYFLSKSVPLSILSTHTVWTEILM